MKRREFLRHISVAGGVAALGVDASLAVRAASASPDPLFTKTLSDPQGGKHDLASFLGKPVVVNFWATWCPPCVKEMPDLDALHKKYPAVNFVGLAVDTAPKVQAFIKKIQVSYPLLIIGHDGIALMRELGNKPGGLPFTVVFDAKGRMTSHVLGKIQPEALEKLFQELPA